MKKKEKKIKKDKKSAKRNKKVDDNVIDAEVTEPKRKYKVIRSTQSSVPIKYVSGNVVFTTDGRYVKIIEAEAIPFLLKTTADQNKIYSAFRQIMKSGPVKMQIKCLTLPGDMHEQLKRLRENRKFEHNETVLKFFDDYENRLLDSQTTSVTRRFFIVFEYTEPSRRKRKTTTEDIMRSLRNVSRRVMSVLDQCGNDARELDTDETLQVFYEIYNRDRSRTVPFENVYKQVVSRYLDYYDGNIGDNCYIPFEEFVAPEKIDYTNSRYLIVNDSTYYRFMVILADGYPDYMWPGWVDTIVSFGYGVDVDFFFQRENKEFLTGKLERNIGQSLAVLGESKEQDSSAFHATQSYEASSYLLEGIRSGQEFFYVNTLITITGSSPEEVDLYAEEVRKSLSNMDIKAIELETQYEEAFQSALPLCKLDKNIFEKSKHNMLTEGAATFYPFTTFEMNDPEGIDLGYGVDSGSEVVVDFFNHHIFTNANGFICGMPGAGKTYTMLFMSIRFRLSQTPVMIMAPEKEHEFMRLCDAIGGSFIKLSKEGKKDGDSEQKILNPMEIFSRDKAGADIDDTIDGGDAMRASLMSSKIDSLITLFELIIGEQFKDYNEKVALERLFTDTYKRFGITADNESLWADKEKTHFKKMPIFSDVKETMDSYKEPMSPKITNIIGQFTDGSLSNFNGQTNVDTNNSFIVFGLQHNEEAMMPAAMYIAMDFVWAKFQENRTKKKILLIDEWWKMAYNPVAADYSMKLARLVRGYGGSVWFATQQMTDIVNSGERGLAVLGNCQTKILMKMSAQDVSAVSEMMNLTPTEEDKIERYKPGEALLIAGTTRMQIRFKASNTEDLYCATDRESLTRFYNMKQEEERRKQQEQDRINAMPNMDDDVEKPDIIDIEIDDGTEDLDDIIDDDPYSNYTSSNSKSYSFQGSNDDFDDLDNDIENDIDDDIADLDSDLDL